MSPTCHKASTLSAVAACLALFAACGSRGPLDVDPVAAEDAQADVLVPDAQEAAIADATPGARADSGIDARPGTPIDCGICVATSCGAPILACIQNPSCAATFQCVATTCLSGGAINPACLFKCASGDPAGALQILQIFQCLTVKCGPDCQSVLGLLGGGGPPGIDGGGKLLPPTPGNGDERAAEDFVQIFSRWPELVSRPPSQKR